MRGLLLFLTIYQSAQDATKNTHYFLHSGTWSFYLLAYISCVTYTMWMKNSNGIAVAADANANADAEAIAVAAAAVLPTVCCVSYHNIAKQ